MKGLLLSAFVLSALLMSCSDDDSGPSKKSLSVAITGLQNLGPDFVYEGWVIVDGSPVSTGTFTVLDDGSWSASSFDVASGDLEKATKFVLTIEPTSETGDAAATPSAQKLLAGDFSGNSAAVSTSVAPAVGDFSDIWGKFFLRTPTDEAAGTGNNGNDQYGVWFGIPGTMPPGVGLGYLHYLQDGNMKDGWLVKQALFLQEDSQHLMQWIVVILLAEQKQMQDLLFQEKIFC